MNLLDMFTKVATKNGLVFAFLLIGVITLITYKISAMTKGKENKVIMLLHAVKVTDSATSPFASIEKTLLELPPGLHATSMIPIMNKGDK